MEKAHDQSSSFSYRQEDQIKRAWINVFLLSSVCTEPCKPIKGLGFFLFSFIYN